MIDNAFRILESAKGEDKPEGYRSTWSCESTRYQSVAHSLARIAAERPEYAAQIASRFVDSFMGRTRAYPTPTDLRPDVTRRALRFAWDRIDMEVLLDIALHATEDMPEKVIDFFILNTKRQRLHGSFEPQTWNPPMVHDLRAHAAKALGACAGAVAKIGRSEDTVESLRHALSDTHRHVRVAALESLGQFGLRAKEAIPDIEAAKEGCLVPAPLAEEALKEILAKSYRRYRLR